MNKECKKCKHPEDIHAEKGCTVEGCDCKVFEAQSQWTNQEKHISAFTNQEKEATAEFTNLPKHKGDWENLPKS